MEDQQAGANSGKAPEIWFGTRRSKVRILPPGPDPLINPTKSICYGAPKGAFSVCFGPFSTLDLLVFHQVVGRGLANVSYRLSSSSSGRREPCLFLALFAHRSESGLTNRGNGVSPGNPVGSVTRPVARRFPLSGGDAADIVDPVGRLLRGRPAVARFQRRHCRIALSGHRRRLRHSQP